MALGIAYFGANGYTVNIPLNDTQWYDFVVEKDGVFSTVQCKFTASKDGVVSLRSTGGTKGKVYGNVLDNPVDFLFCVNEDGKLWNIPVEKIRKSGNSSQITLREARPAMAYSGFDSTPYLVSI